MYYHFLRSMITHKHECMNKLHVSSEMEILVSPVTGTYIMQVVELRAGVTYHSFVCNKKNVGLVLLKEYWLFCIRERFGHYLFALQTVCIYMYMFKKMLLLLYVYISTYACICYSCNYKITWPYICNFNWTDAFFSLFVFITFPESVILHINISNIMYIYSYDNQTCVSFPVCCRAVDWYCASFPI